MIPATEQHYVFPESVPTALVYLLAVVAIGVWVLTHLPRRRSAGWPRLAMFALRAVVGFLAMLAVAQAMQRGLVLATNWPIWPIALLGALAVEIVLGLYGRERQTVSRRAGLALVALRVAIVALVVIMLAQPVRPWNLDKTIQRFVAVLLDESASMHIPDTELRPAEKMRLAETLSIEGIERPYKLDLVSDELNQLREDLAAQAEGLASIAATEGDARAKRLAAHRENLNKVLVQADQTVVELIATVAEPLKSSLKLDPSVVNGLEDIRKRLTSPVRDSLTEAIALTDAGSADRLDAEGDRLAPTIRKAVTELADLAGRTEAMGRALDEAAYAAFTPEQRAKVDVLAAKKRLALAHATLNHRAPVIGENGETTGQRPSLIDRLKENYGVKMFTFASKPSEVALDEYTAGYVGLENPKGEAAELPPDQQQTDFTGVFEKVMTEMQGQPLSGVLLLSDGRHNATKSVEPLVRQLGIRQVPVSSVVFGSDDPPVDAGIISVEAPETIAVRDQMLVTTQVKLDGLAGKEVRVALMDGDKVVDTETVRVPTSTYRARVQFADEPSAIGLHRYAVDVQQFDGEVLASNNRYPLAVSVSDARTKLLVIDSRPRWEFRYIKNLFASRDKTVHLQYLLLDPDRIEGTPPAPKIEASASRPVEEIEATALPKDETEWMKFDVVILGDVSPKAFGDEELRILQRFVTDRGGTLIVLAGPEYMPHAFGDADDSVLANLLPVKFEKSADPVRDPPEESFRIALTAEGRESVILRQQVDPIENLKVWDEVPELYWRHPILQTKEGATVLAYALPKDAPSFVPRPSAADGAADEEANEEVLGKRRQFERQHALISLHNVAMGKVMFLSTDRTWRLRYRVGDAYHHRLWGQILRWATANKLPAGTETVKLGTDRTRYAPGAPVRVRAKIAKKDYTPIKSDEVYVNVFVGNDLKHRQQLKFLPNSAGLYEAHLGALPSGTYRLELDAPPAKPVLQEQNADGVSLEFSVDPSTPAEQTELARDRGLLSRLATLTGGTVADPSRADRVLDTLGPVTETEIERHEYVLWDSVPLLVLIVLAATTEWLLRKKVGLA